MPLGSRTSSASRVTDCRWCQNSSVPLKLQSSFIFNPKTIWNGDMFRLSLLHLIFQSTMKYTTDWILYWCLYHHWDYYIYSCLRSSLLAEPSDNESETNGHLTRMWPRLIMNICPIFYGPVFSQCKLANSESWLHSHTCTQLSYLLWNQFLPDLPWKRIPGNK